MYAPNGTSGNAQDHRERELLEMRCSLRELEGRVCERALLTKFLADHREYLVLAVLRRVHQPTTTIDEMH